LLAVVVGGLVGTGLRLGLDTVIPHRDSGFPFSTLLVNIVGAFALGLLVARLWPRLPDWARAGLGAGLLGSFTTFSALAVSLVSLAAANEWMLAVVYLLASLAVGLAAAWAGLRIGSRRATPIDLADE
jgi:fluoride exporter